jgi:hypothetical protein
VNDGATCVVIVISIVVVAPHCPAAGVKVYVDIPTIDVLIVEGFQVPVNPLFDVVGKAGGALFWHRNPIAVNVGVTCAVTSMVIVEVVPHCPAEGVKV